LRITVCFACLAYYGVIREPAKRFVALGIAVVVDTGWDF
jgi:hypothetical protein